MTEKPRRLGRGLEALISSTGKHASQATATQNNGSDEETRSALRTLRIADVRPNPFQPRRDFKPDELAELEHSLRTSGLLQPVTVRPRAAGGFELVAGERRLRAATRLGWTEIPAIVKTLDDRDMLTLALIENLQRADLNPLDEALGYQRLIADFALTQQQVADAVGKDRTTVTNLLRVLQLPDGLQRLLRDGQLSLGHARAILGLPNERAMIDAARLVVDRGISVREVERLVQEARAGKGTHGTTPGTSPNAPRHANGAPGTAPHTSSAELRRLTELLRRHLQTDVRITADGNAHGDISVKFYSTDDLHRLLELVLGRSLDDA